MFNLKIIPYYIDKKDLNLKEVLMDKRAKSILWLEIIFNDSIEWEDLFDFEEVRKAYEKASIWYHTFKSLIKGHIQRKPLKVVEGKIDEKEYRRFLEVLNFVSSNS